MTVFPYLPFAQDSTSEISRLFIVDLMWLQDYLSVLEDSLLVTAYKIEWWECKKKMLALATSAWHHFKLNLGELKDRGDWSVSILGCELFDTL
jgi:hypothetical protein